MSVNSIEKKVDIHIHTGSRTHAKDINVFHIVAIDAILKGLHGIVITDHFDVTDQWEKFESNIALFNRLSGREFRYDPFTVIPGCEFSTTVHLNKTAVSLKGKKTSGGEKTIVPIHFNIMSTKVDDIRLIKQALQPEKNKIISPEEALTVFSGIKSATVIINHPESGKRSPLTVPYNLAAIAELRQGKFGHYIHGMEAKKQSLVDLAHEYQWAAVAGSDMHPPDFDRIGKEYTGIMVSKEVITGFDYLWLIRNDHNLTEGDYRVYPKYGSKGIKDSLWLRHLFHISGLSR